MTRPRLLLCLLAIALAAPLEASARSPAKRTPPSAESLLLFDDEDPVGGKKNPFGALHREDVTADEVLAAYTKVYAAEVVKITHTKKAKTVRLQTTARYKGATPRTTELSDKDPTPCVLMTRASLPRVGAHPKHTRSRLRFTPGDHLLVLRNSSGCDYLLEPYRRRFDADAPPFPKSVDEWKARWDAETQRRIEAREAQARKRAERDEAARERRRLDLCTPSGGRFPQATLETADLVVAGRIASRAGTRTQVQVDTVYARRAAAGFDPSALAIASKAITVDFPEVLLDYHSGLERVVLLTDRQRDGSYTVSECAQVMPMEDDQPYPNRFGALEAVSAEQLDCPALSSDREDGGLADVVFHAKVDGLHSPSSGSTRVTLADVTAFKNNKGIDLEAPLVFSHTEPYASGSFPLTTPNREVLVFGTIDAKGQLHVNRCGASRHADKPDEVDVPVTSRDVFQCVRETLTEEDYAAAAVVGHGRLVRVDDALQPPVAEFVMDGFHKGAERSKEGRVFVTVPPEEVAFQHDADTLLVLAATDAPHRFELTSCGVQRVFEGAPPTLLGHEPVRYDPKAHQSSCAAAPPARAPGAPGAWVVLLAWVGGLVWRRRSGRARA
jgi:hypothetical protein